MQQAGKKKIALGGGTLTSKCNPVLQIRYLEEGSRVHQTEMEWLRLKMQHKHEHEIGVLKQRHDMFEKDSKQTMDELMCAQRSFVKLISRVLCYCSSTLYTIHSPVLLFVSAAAVLCKASTGVRAGPHCIILHGFTSMHAA